MTTPTLGEESADPSFGAERSRSGDAPADGGRDFDVLVFIGRFQPFHRGHKAVIDAALARVRQVTGRVIVLVGSARQPRTIRNPWTFEERADMILGAWPEAERARLLVAPLPDRRYNDQAWIGGVQRTVHDLVAGSGGAAGGDGVRIGLIGASRDGSGYSPRMFPQWPAVAAVPDDGLRATPLRQRFFAGRAEAEVWLNTEAGAVVPANVVGFLARFLAAPDGAYGRIAAEAAYIRDYLKGWDAAPYPPVFVTVDAVVVQSGHVLMVERKAMPGQGLLALPGGFIGQTEPLRTAMLRELSEETRIAVPAAVLDAAIRAQQVFDAPYRSMRGRTITHAFLIVLPDSAEGLPAVEGDDDAASAAWVPLGELDPIGVFEDHWHIIQTMLGRL